MPARAPQRRSADGHCIQPRTDQHRTDHHRATQPRTHQPRTHQPRTGSRAGCVQWALGEDPAAVPRLRRSIMQRLRAIAAQDADLDATEIVVGELLGNALVHARGPAWVSLRWDGAHPRLTVADSGPELPGPGQPPGRAIVDQRRLVPRLPEDPLAESGRGMFLIGQLALAVAVAPGASGGTVVVVTLDLARAS